MAAEHDDGLQEGGYTNTKHEPDEERQLIPSTGEGCTAAAIEAVAVVVVNGEEVGWGGASHFWWCCVCVYVVDGWPSKLEFE